MVPSLSTQKSKRPIQFILLLAAICFTAYAYLQIPPSNSPSADLNDFPHFVISTVAGNGTEGFSGDNGPAVDAQIQRPTAVAIDSKGNLYIAEEQNHRVRCVSPDGMISTVVGTGKTEMQQHDMAAIETNLSSPYGIAVDGQDNLYVLSRGHNKIFKVGPDKIAKRIVGTGVAGFSGDSGPAVDAQIRFTNHLVVDSKGNIYIADTGNHRIRKVSINGIISTIAGTGERGFGGDHGPASQALLNNPVAIAADSTDNLFIADFTNHRIRKITTNGVISTVAGNGQSRYNGEGWPATESHIGEPCGVAVDRFGNVFIADQINKRVRVVTKSGLMFTTAGTGKKGHTGDGGPAEKARVANPDIIAFDTDGNLFLPDHQNVVIRKLTPTRTASEASVKNRQ